MEDTADLIRTSDSVVKLNKDNFLEFREAVMDKALRFGEPGIWLINGAYVGDTREPTFDMHVLIPDPDNPGAMIEGARRYPVQGTAGQQMFQADLARYHKNREKSLALISWLLTNVERDIRAKLEGVQNFRQACAGADILAVWNAIQDTVMGRGSISVFSVMARYMKVKQSGPGDFARYVKDFTALRNEYRRYMGGNAERILEVVDTCLFIKGCDQAFFKEKLQAIYGATNWGQVDTIITEFNTYAINRERMSDLIRDNNNGAIPAYKVDGGKAGDYCCWNCGEDGHRKFECTQPRHDCSICGKNHLEKFCDHKKGSNNGKGKQGKVSPGKGPGNGPSKRGDTPAKGKEGKPSRKAQKRKRLLQKSAAYVLQTWLNGEDTPDSSIGEIDEQEEEEVEADLVEVIDHGGDLDKEMDRDNGKGNALVHGIAENGENLDVEDIDVVKSYMIHEVEMPAINNTSGERATELEALKVALKDISSEYFILDTGCKRINICKNLEMLENITEANVSVVGITGDSCSAKKLGILPVAHKTLWAPNADANLISVRQLIEDYGGSFVGDTKALVIRDRDGEELITGRTKFGGFWACTYQDLVDARDRRRRKKVVAYPGDVMPVQSTAVIKHYTPEERSRALKAWRLCPLLGHPGFETIKRDLNNNCLLGTNLTARDVTNGVELYGPCLGCLEGKMRGPDETPSTSPPAYEVGEHLHADIVPLSAVSIGGGTVMLAAVDEKSGYFSLVIMPDKGAKTIGTSFEHIVSFYKTYGHTVKKVTTDSESALLKAKQPLGLLGVQLTATPAGMHEKRVERYIQTLKARKRAMLASLPYKLPTKLEGELYQAAAKGMNDSSNTVSQPYTPRQIVTGQRPEIPEFKFGQPGITHSRRDDDRNLRAEYGIFLSHGDAIGSIRVYIPLRDQVYSRRVFKALDHVPQEWGFEPRLRINKVTNKAPTPVEDLINQPELTPVGEPRGLLPSEIYHRLNLDEYGEVGNMERPFDQEGALNWLHPAPTPVIATEGTPVREASLLPEPPQEMANTQAEPLLRQKPTVVESTDVEQLKVQEGGVVEIDKSKTDQEQKATEINEAQSNRPWRTAKAHRGWKEGRYFAMTTTTARRINRARCIEFAFRISLRTALADKQLGPDAYKSIEEEIKNIMNNNVVKPVHKNSIPKEEWRNIIPTHMFLKLKYKADGSFDKLKARLVVNGDKQAFDTIGETFSPTINQISVNTQLNYTAWTGAHLSSYDIKGAFLKTKVQDGKRIYVRLGKEESNLWTIVYPQHAKYLDNNGSLNFQLLAYMYGLCEAPNQFHALLDKTLKHMGFNPTRADQCMYTKRMDSQLMVLSVHVDDILLTSPTLKARTWFEQTIQKYFEIVIQHDKISYIGMNIKYNRKAKVIQATQEGFVNDLIKRYECQSQLKKPATPCGNDLFDEDKDGEQVSKKDYLSLIMSLMFVARYTRYDILLPVTILATFSAQPTKTHYAKAMKALKYLSINPSLGPVFRGDQPLTPMIYADASHAIHPSGHGQGGIVMTLGSAPVFCRSFKLKSITRSSSESELYALEEGSTYAIWWKAMLEDLEVINKNNPITIFQDNISTIFLATNGGTFKRTKHLITREMFVRERITSGEIELKHSPTEKMRADFLTKPMSRYKLEDHITALSLTGNNTQVIAN